MTLQPSSRMLLLRSGIEVVNGDFCSFRRISLSTASFTTTANTNQLISLRESFIQVGVKK